MILDQLGLALEDHCTSFPQEADGARESALHLRKVAALPSQRATPGTHIKGEGWLVDLIGLEQFMDGLPVDTAVWVCCHRPADRHVVVKRSENHLSVQLRESVSRPKLAVGSQPVPTPGRQLWVCLTAGPSCYGQCTPLTASHTSVRAGVLEV